MLTFKLQKEDWLKAEPRNACNCVFARRVKAILDPDAEEHIDSVSVDANHKVEIEFINSENEDLRYEVANDHAVNCLTQFDELYCPDTYNFAQKAEHLTDEGRAQYKLDSPEARLALYELYKDIEWELEQVDSFAWEY